VSALLAMLLTVAIALGPAPALAERLPEDEIAGTPLEESQLTSAAPDIDAAAGAIVAPDGRTLWARCSGDQRAIASVTKVMTALIVLEETDLDETVTISEKASRVPYARGLDAGETYNVRELLEFALVASSNDAAIALAEHVAGSETAFAGRMNLRAEEMGLADTRFVNAHGLDTAGHYSCAGDIATLALAAMRHDEFRRIVALEEITIPEYKERAARTIESTDELLGTYPGLLGIKTGFTENAKYTFVTAAERDGVELTAVILGARSSDARFKNAASLLDWGFEHFSMRQIANTTETVGAVPLAANPERTVEVRFAEESSTPVFDLDGEVSREIVLDADVALPVFEGKPLGEVELAQGDRPLATLGLVAAEDVASAEETVGAVPVSDYVDRSVPVRASGEEIDVPEYDALVTVDREVVLDPEIAAPVSVGDELGEIVYSQDGDVIVTVPVLATADVEAPATVEKVGIWFTRAWRWVTGKPTMATLELVAE
jgi:D-alanyl-D-alanine carboxypeptidase